MGTQKVGGVGFPGDSTMVADGLSADAASIPIRITGHLSGRVQDGVVIPSSSGAALAGAGLLDTITVVDFSSSLQVAATGNAFRQNTNTPLGNNAGWDVGTDIIHFSAKPFACAKFALGQTSLSRSFLGISDQTRAVMTAADDPAGNYVGLQARDGDSNFFVVHKNGTTLVRTDTSIALDTSVHFLVVEVDSPTSVVVTLQDATGADQFSVTITSGLPASGTLMEPMVGVENRSAGTGRFIDTYSMRLALRV